MPLMEEAWQQAPSAQRAGSTPASRQNDRSGHSAAGTSCLKYSPAHRVKQHHRRRVLSS